MHVIPQEPPRQLKDSFKMHVNDYFIIINRLLLMFNK